MAEEKKTEWQDPYRGYNFRLEIQNQTVGHFVNCSGINAKVEAISYRESGNNQIVHRLPGKVTYEDVKLSYGLTDNTILWDWFQKGLAGEVDRRNVSIILLDSKGSQEEMRWNLFNAWPSEWQSTTLDTLGSETAIETLKLTFEGVERMGKGKG
jgi:phage tail-like protein